MRLLFTTIDNCLASSQQSYLCALRVWRPHGDHGLGSCSSDAAAQAQSAARHLKANGARAGHLMGDNSFHTMPELGLGGGNWSESHKLGRKRNAYRLFILFAHGLGFYWNILLLNTLKSASYFQTIIMNAICAANVWAARVCCRR